MSDRKRTPANAATSAGAELGAETGQATTSNNDFTTSGAAGQRISALLGTGAAQALTISDLHRLTGLDKRTIRLEIQNERLHGIPILSDCRSGYFLPADNWERTQCVRSLLHRAREIERVARAIEGAAGLD